MTALPDPAGAVQLCLGGATLPVGPAPHAVDEMALARMIAAANQRSRIDGLADALNPDIVDPVKALGFARGLAAQAPATLAALAGHELDLDWADLGLLAAAPTRPEAFAAPFDLVIDEVQGRHVLAHTSVPVDPAGARAASRAAARALAAADRIVQHMERPGSPAAGGELADARLRRSAAARAWRLNAAAWAQADGAGRRARHALADAEAAVARYLMPRGGLAEPLR